MILYSLKSELNGTLLLHQIPALIWMGALTCTTVSVCCRCSGLALTLPQTESTSAPFAKQSHCLSWQRAGRRHVQDLSRFRGQDLSCKPGLRVAQSLCANQVIFSLPSFPCFGSACLRSWRAGWTESWSKALLMICQRFMMVVCSRYVFGIVLLRSRFAACLLGLWSFFSTLVV